MAERRVIIQRDSDYNADDANLIIRTALPEVSSGTGTTFQQEFRVHRQTLCAASTVWAGMIETLVNGAGGSRETRVAGQTEESSTSIKVEAADEGEGQGQSAGTEHTGESRDAVHDLPVLILPENLFTLRTLLAAAYNRHEGMKLELTTSWLTVLTVWEAAVKYEMFVLRSYAQMTLMYVPPISSSIFALLTF